VYRNMGPWGRSALTDHWNNVFGQNKVHTQTKGERLILWECPHLGKVGCTWESMG
jgi:hypothetical protein